MYRAHVQVYDEKGKRLGAKSLATALPNRAIGTRAGAPGLWVERASKADFIYAVTGRKNAIEAMGYSIRVFTTNAPSQEALRWQPGLTGKVERG